MLQSIVGFGRRVAGMSADETAPKKPVVRKVTAEEQEGLLRSTKIRIEGCKEMLNDAKVEKQAAIKALDSKTAAIKTAECRKYEADIQQLQGEYNNMMAIKETIARADANRIQAGTYVEASAQLEALATEVEESGVEDAISELQMNGDRLNSLSQQFSKPIFSTPAADDDNQLDVNDEVEMMIEAERLRQMQSPAKQSSTGDDNGPKNRPPQQQQQRRAVEDE